MRYDNAPFEVWRFLPIFTLLKLTWFSKIDKIDFVYSKLLCSNETFSVIFKHRACFL